MQANICVYVYACTHVQGLVVHISLGSALAVQACDVRYTVSLSYLCNLYAGHCQCYDEYNYKPMILISVATRSL